MIHSGDGERGVLLSSKVNNIITSIFRKIQNPITSNGDVKFSYFERYNKICWEVLLNNKLYKYY